MTRGRDDTGGKAYALAEDRIAEAKAGGHVYLNLSGSESERTFEGETRAGDEALRPLTTLPPQIADLTTLRRLDLDGTQVADLEPIRGMNGMQRLSLNDTQVADLEPIRGMNGMQTLYLTAHRWPTSNRSAA